MKAFWYLLTLVLGLFGALLLVRGAEVLIQGGSATTALLQILVGVLVFVGAKKTLDQARAS